MAMSYGRAVALVNENIEKAAKTLKVGRWLTITEHGILKSFSKTRYFHETKIGAIQEYGNRCMDARKAPLIDKIAPGRYYYYVKDCKDGRDHEPVEIVKLTARNQEEYRTKLREKLGAVRDEEILPLFDNPLYDDAGLECAVMNRIRLDIYNEEDVMDEKEGA